MSWVPGVVRQTRPVPGEQSLSRYFPAAHPPTSYCSAQDPLGEKHKKSAIPSYNQPICVCILEKCFWCMQSNQMCLSSKKTSCINERFATEYSCKRKEIKYFYNLTLAPIWLPHWPAWMCTISLIMDAKVWPERVGSRGVWMSATSRTEPCRAGQWIYKAGAFPARGCGAPIGAWPHPERDAARCDWMRGLSQRVWGGHRSRSGRGNQRKRQSWILPAGVRKHALQLF